MVDEAVDDGGGDVVVSEDGAPSGEFDVGGDDEAGVFVGVGDDLVEESGSVRVGSRVHRWLEGRIWCGWLVHGRACLRLWLCVGS